eukprot:CAMPEP_0175116064 /NCGR_PEP_ID=MMETSP0086_2-20121207/17964_1 /TAXON_ID=136419 /ORGANISM="Unknown Unknown, Strain D1" /LENGTH=177 /DNA_ID=CAMNT_0016396303 /DNA_START=185 /DNA_END=715 /DNA_ORIENTATION=-
MAQKILSVNDTGSFSVGSGGRSLQTLLVLFLDTIPVKRKQLGPLFTVYFGDLDFLHARTELGCKNMFAVQHVWLGHHNVDESGAGAVLECACIREMHRSGVQGGDLKECLPGLRIGILLDYTRITDVKSLFKRALEQEMKAKQMRIAEWCPFVESLEKHEKRIPRSHLSFCTTRSVP